MQIPIDTLRRFNLFASLTDEQLAKISQIMTIKHQPKGSLIIIEGETGEEMFILLEGEIVVSKRLTLQEEGTSETKEKSLVKLKDSFNIFFGEMSMFEGGERSATVTALTDVRLGVLNREKLKVLCNHDPALGYQIYYQIGTKIAGDLRRANRDVLKLTTAFVLALECK